MAPNELRYLRRIKNVRQQQLADEISKATGVHVNQRTISSWELGVTNPKPFQYQFLEDFFHVPKEEIFREAFEYRDQRHMVNK